MKNSKICPKCGGQDIVVIRGRDAQDRVRLPLDDYLWAERYLCCTCGYMESWVDPEKFVKKGGKSYWAEQEDDDAYWREKLREKREKEAQQERTEEKRKNRRDDPWT